MNIVQSTSYGALLFIKVLSPLGGVAYLSTLEAPLLSFIKFCLPLLCKVINNAYDIKGQVEIRHI